MGDIQTYVLIEIEAVLVETTEMMIIKKIGAPSGLYNPIRKISQVSQCLNCQYTLPGGLSHWSLCHLRDDDNLHEITHVCPNCSIIEIQKLGADVNFKPMDRGNLPIWLPHIYSSGTWKPNICEVTKCCHVWVNDYDQESNTCTSICEDCGIDAIDVFEEIPPIYNPI